MIQSMKRKKPFLSVLAGILAAVLLLNLIWVLIPTPANAASSGEIRRQIDQLKEEKERIQEKIADVQAQFEENENEIANIIAKKNIIDQEIQLLHEQLVNIDGQLSAFNTLIADKQEELDDAKNRYAHLNEENEIRIRTMEEEGEISFWEVIFQAHSFPDLLDRLNMIQEIAASDKRRLEQLSKAADEVEIAQDVLELEKAEMEATRQEMDITQATLDSKRAQADALILELLSKADDLEALKAEFEAQQADFLDMIAKTETEFDEAKRKEWEDYMATYEPPSTQPPSGSGDNGDGSAPGGGGGWLVPCSYSSITSPFGYRQSPTTGASSYHQGVDLDSTTGTPVVASRAGVVTVAGWGSAAGNYVQIDHQDGFRTIYMHLNNYSVRTGQIVSAGQTIGTVGSTGVATGDHLHFGISLNGVYVNPCNYVNLH